MAMIRSAIQMTERELKAWQTVGSLPTCIGEEHVDRSVTTDSLSSCSSSDKEDTDLHGDCRSTPSSPSSATRAAPSLEDVDSATRYDRSLLLQVRLNQCRAEQGNEAPINICCKDRQQCGKQAPEVKTSATPKGADEVAGKTTVMLRNLPNQCTRAMLAKFLSATEFAGQFDLIYVPMDRVSGNNLGYSFINFVEATSCQRFIRAMNGTKAAKCFAGSRSGKVLHCNYAKVQGKEPYCMGLVNAASKLCAMGDELAAWETMAPVPLANEEHPTKFQGMRSDAPEFVPGQMKAFNGAQIFNIQDTAREEAIALARCYSSKLSVPGQSSSLFVPPMADEESLPAETN